MMLANIIHPGGTRHWRPFVCDTLNAVFSKVGLWGEVPDWQLSSKPKHFALSFFVAKSAIFQSNSTVIIMNEAPKSLSPFWLMSQHCNLWVEKIMSQLHLASQKLAWAQSGHVFKLFSANRRDGNFSCRNEIEVCVQCLRSKLELEYQLYICEMLDESGELVETGSVFMLFFCGDWVWFTPQDCMLVGLKFSLCFWSSFYSEIYFSNKNIV